MREQLKRCEACRRALSTPPLSSAGTAASSGDGLPPHGRSSPKLSGVAQLVLRSSTSVGREVLNVRIEALRGV